MYLASLHIKSWWTIPFWLCLALITLMFIIYLIYNAHNDKTKYHVINDERLPLSFSGFNIFFIADVHRRTIRTRTLQLITEEIDAILIGGDFIERGVPLSRARLNIQKLKKFGAPIYFVWGNNDYEALPAKLLQMFQEEHVIVLHDEVVRIKRDSEFIQLIGFNYVKENVQRKTIKWEKLGDTFTLLLTHTPQSFFELQDTYQKYIHFVLAGHTHGGQIRIFNLGFFKRGKLFRYRHTHVLITEGYGYSVLPFRLQTEAQCHVIHLTKN